MFTHINASKTQKTNTLRIASGRRREAYQKNISLSELRRRLKAEGDGEESNSPLPHNGDMFVSHESYEEVSQQDAPGGHEAALREAALGEAAAREGAARAPPVITVVPGGHNAESHEAVARAPPVISFVPGAQEVASREATLQEVAAQEGAARAPPVITVVPGGHDAALQEAGAREAA